MKKMLLLPMMACVVLMGEELEEIVVDGSKENSSTQISSSTIGREKIQSAVVGNGFISSLLRTNPAIDVTDSSRNSETAGEIKPGKVSINKTPSYQNNFMIDGISNNSMLDPVISSTTDPYDVPGNENEVFLDLDLVDSIKVYTSNISAEFGNFTGGVIDAKTIRPKGKLSAKVSWTHTSDKLLKIHVNNKDEFEKAKSDSSQPRFEKNFFNTYVSTPIDESNGVLFSYSYKRSVIPGAYFYTFKDKIRENQSFYTKYSHYYDDDSIIDISAAYSPYRSTHFQEFVKDSETTIKGGGYSLKGNYEKSYENWNLNTNLAFKGSENSKKSLNYNKMWFRRGNKDWGPVNTSGGISYSEEGGTGNIKKTQTGLEYNFKANVKEFKTFGIFHGIKSGIFTSYNKGTYNRKQPTTYYKNAQKSTSNNGLGAGWGVSCMGYTNACEDAQQYFATKRVYQKEKVNASIVSTGLYVENQMRFERFEFTPGLRVDYNDYLKNIDTAYRLNASIRPFNSPKTIVYGGFNRYYGKSFLGYKLREGRLPYYEQYRNTRRGKIPGTNGQVGLLLNPWGTSATHDGNKYVFNDLKTPYSDERSIGIIQDIDLIKTRVNLKYVHLERRNEFTREDGAYKVYYIPYGDGTKLKAYYKPRYFTNGGHSSTEITTLSVGSSSGVDLGFATMSYSLGSSWAISSSNSASYESEVNDDDKTDTTIVYYKGKFLDRKELPISSDPKDYSVDLDFVVKPMKIFGIPFTSTLNSVITYHAPYKDVQVQDGSKTVKYTETLPDDSKKAYNVPIYEDIHFHSAITVDMHANFNFKLHGQNTLMLSTEITNLFDKVQNVGTSTIKYKTGRQIWFSVAYKY